MISKLKKFQKSLIDVSNDNINNYHKWIYKNSKTYININKVDSVRFSKRCEIKMCFNNCIKIALCHHELKYIEGHVLCFGIPLEHAFLVNDKNEVIDPTLAIPTLRESERYGNEYYGVEIPRGILLKYVFRKNTFIPMPYLYWEELNKK